MVRHVAAVGVVVVAVRAAVGWMGAAHFKTDNGDISSTVARQHLMMGEALDHTSVVDL